MRRRSFLSSLPSPFSSSNGSSHEPPSNSSNWKKTSYNKLKSSRDHLPQKTACASSVYIWGRGDGQLGNGELQENQKLPLLLHDLEGKYVISVSSGGKHTIALTDSGDVYTWGWNFNGQLGYEFKEQFSPRLVKPLVLTKALHQKYATAITAGSVSSAAITNQGDVYTWGGNSDHQLGHGDENNHFTPRLVLPLHKYRIAKIACGGCHTLALTVEGVVLSWGRNNNGRLGHGHTEKVLVPRKVKSLKGYVVTKIACGWSHSMCYSEKDGGTLWTWGSGGDGRLGHGDTSDRLVPATVEALQGTPLSHITGGYYHSGVITATREPHVYTWGWGEHGQLGHGNTQTELLPSLVELLDGKNIVGLQCGGFHTIAFNDEGTCWTFGLGENGQLGIIQLSIEGPESGEPNLDAPNQLAVPTVVEALKGKKVINVAAGWWHSIAIVASDECSVNQSNSFSDILGEIRLLESELRLKTSEYVEKCSLLSQVDDTSILDVSPRKGSLNNVDTHSDDSDDGTEDLEEWSQEEEKKENLHSSGHQHSGLLHKITNWIFPNEDFSATLEALREKRQEQEGQYWEKFILPRWNRMKNNSKVRALWKNGIPPSVRGKVWIKAIPNLLAITPDQYASLKDQAHRLRNARLEENRKAGLQDDEGASLIELDLPRTFPTLSLFHQEGPFYTQLLDILETYGCYRPEVGYVQGMSFLAAMFLLYMDDYSTFVCLSNLLDSGFFRSLYKVDIPQILRFVKVYELLFSQHLPSVYEHFKHIGISPEHYLLDWFFTIFSRALPFEIVGRVWDRFFLEGEAFLFRTALAILKICWPTMKRGTFEQIVMILRQLPQDLDETQLFEAIHTITVPGYCLKFLHRIRTEQDSQREIQMEWVKELEEENTEGGSDGQPSQQQQQQTVIITTTTNQNDRVDHHHRQADTINKT